MPTMPEHAKTYRFVVRERPERSLARTGRQRKAGAACNPTRVKPTMPKRRKTSGYMPTMRTEFRWAR
jgi:hypothetical protein